MRRNPHKQADLANRLGRDRKRKGAFLNRESEVRILPGALLKVLQMSGKRKAQVRNRGSTTPITTPTQLSERCVHRAGGVSHVGEYVRVDVEGKAYVRVA
jgi:hypothetical protein